MNAGNDIGDAGAQALAAELGSDCPLTSLTFGGTVLVVSQECDAHFGDVNAIQTTTLVMSAYKHLGRHLSATAR
jgi:hypothetical protein